MELEAKIPRGFRQFDCSRRSGKGSGRLVRAFEIWAILSRDYSENPQELFDISMKD